MYTNQRLNLSKLWEGLRKTCQGFKPDSGNLTVRDYRGASENVRHGETVNPPAIERAGAVTPHLQRGASDFYPSDVCSPSVVRDDPGSEQLGINIILPEPAKSALLSSSLKPAAAGYSRPPNRASTQSHKSLRRRPLMRF